MALNSPADHDWAVIGQSRFHACSKSEKGFGVTDKGEDRPRRGHCFYVGKMYRWGRLLDRDCISEWRRVACILIISVPYLDLELSKTPQRTRR